MKKPYRRTTRFAALLLLVAGGALAGCTSLSTAPTAAVQHQIDAARTPADHEALAKYYDGEIASARSRAADHRQMGKRYAAEPVSRSGGGSMQVHCNAVAASYDQIAERFAAMAAEHRKMAEQAKP